MSPFRLAVASACALRLEFDAAARRKGQTISADVGPCGSRQPLNDASVPFAEPELRFVQLVPFRISSTIRVSDASFRSLKGRSLCTSSHVFLQEGCIAHSIFRSRGSTEFPSSHSTKAESVANPTPGSAGTIYAALATTARRSQRSPSSKVLYVATSPNTVPVVYVPRPQSPSSCGSFVRW